jgi:aldose 1-epimerase
MTIQAPAPQAQPDTLQRDTQDPQDTQGTPLDARAAAAAHELALAHPDGLRLRLMTLGATLLSCQVPVAGQLREVLLGCDSPQAYLQQSAYLGATIGRFSNRIAHAELRTPQGQVLALAPTPGAPHQLHGGPGGFHTRLWQVQEHGQQHALLSLVSPAGDQGFPGELHAQVRYELLDALTLQISFEARVSQLCPVSLTNHAYFNLDASPGDVRHHRLQLAAAQYLPVDESLLPLGELASVAGSSFDFRQPKTLAQHWGQGTQQQHAGGYDHAFLLHMAEAESAGQAAATLSSASGDLSLQLHTSLPAIQLYAGQFLAGTPGRHAQVYANCAGVALEPQFLPNSMHHPQWPQPSCWLAPGQVWRHFIRYRFVPG